MIYGYGIWKDIEKKFNEDFPKGTIINFQKYNQITKQHNQGVLSKDNPLIFLRFSKGDRTLMDTLEQECYNLFPNPEFSRFIREREFYLPQVDQITKYPLKRIYFESFTPTIVAEINKQFGDKPVIMKVGNLHASEGKWLLDENRQLPYLKYKMRELPITVEEFIPDARSIRIGFIGNPKDFNNYFITEHINSKTWLKNNNPEEEVTNSYEDRHQTGISHIDDLINEVQNLAVTYNANLLGVDWVISETKTGLLELNDFIGLPDGEFARDLFYREIKKVAGLS